MSELLAKSVDDNRNVDINELYLIPHLRAVEKAGDTLVKSIGYKILQKIGLTNEVWFERLKVVLPLAGLLHDLGKANNSFQDMVKRKTDKHQPIRHELLSVIILMRSEKQLKNYLLQKISSLGSENEKPLINSIYSGILAHHFKLDADLKRACPGLFGDGGYPTEIVAYTNHPDFDILFGPDKPKNDFYFSFLSNHKDTKYKYIKDWIEKFIDLNDELEEFLEENSDWHLFSIILKPLVICSDVIASALVPPGIEYKDWVVKSLNNYITSSDIQQIVQERLKGNTPRSFQLAIANSKERVTLVEAGCGAGKTLGAYLWAEYNAVDSKLYFCYPTTGTATEGYLDYVYDSKYEAKLIHSRSEVDLKGMRASGEESNDVIIDKINALKLYYPKILICTVDTVLALIRNNRKSVLSFPSIATGTIIFDEIHSYTDEMFCIMVHLIKFLSNTKFLLMSASLQPERKELLKREFESISEIETPKELMDLKRYKFNPVQENIEEDILSYSKQDKYKILTVVNTVRKAQEIYRKLKQNGYNAKLYHSRYKYKDRVNRHKEFMQAFRDGSPSVIGVSTQVAEMSLDIDSDILFTEIAPVPALIQRMGRLNRRTTPEKPLPARNVFFYNPKNILPYTKEELEQSTIWIKQLLSKNEVSQSDLQNYFLSLNVTDKELFPAKYYELTKPNFYFTHATDGLRGDVYTINCIVESDLKFIYKNPIELENYIIPMILSKKVPLQDFELYKHAFVIPDSWIDYTPEEGGTWRIVENEQ